MECIKCNTYIDKCVNCKIIDSCDRCNISYYLSSNKTMCLTTCELDIGFYKFYLILFI